MVNAMTAIREGKVPYYIRSGFYIFLESERIRHLKDAEKIERMQEELIKMTPAFIPEVAKEFRRFAERFVEFDFDNAEIVRPKLEPTQ